MSRIYEWLEEMNRNIEHMFEEETFVCPDCGKKIPIDNITHDCEEVEYEK